MQLARVPSRFLTIGTWPGICELESLGAAPTEFVLAAIEVEVEVAALGVEVVAFEVVAGKLDGVTELAGVVVVPDRICSCWCNNP